MHLSRGYWVCACTCARVCACTCACVCVRVRVLCADLGVRGGNVFIQPLVMVDGVLQVLELRGQLSLSACLAPRLHFTHVLWTKALVVIESAHFVMSLFKQRSNVHFQICIFFSLLSFHKLKNEGGRYCQKTLMCFLTIICLSGQNVQKH